MDTHDIEIEISDAHEENQFRQYAQVHPTALSIIFASLRRANDRVTVYSPVERPVKAKKSIRKSKTV